MSLYDEFQGKETILVGYVNKALTEFVFDSLRIYGYKAKTSYDGDVYFIFQGYPHSITHFTINRVLPGWRFGLWAHGEAFLDPNWDESRPVLQLFCQHKSCIDKFKPSASELLVEMDKADFKEVFKGTYKTNFVDRPWSMRAIGEFADQIRLHPALSYEGIMDMRPRYSISHRLIPSMAKMMAEDALEKRYDAIQRRFWASFADMEGKRAIEHPKLESYHVYSDKHMYPPVILDITPTEDATDDELSDICDEMFPHKMKRGRTFHGWGVLRIQIHSNNGGIFTD